MKDKVLEKYAVSLGDVSLDVEVRLEGKQMGYNVVLPSFEPPTRAFMNSVRERLATPSQIMATDMADKAVVSSLREKFGRRIDEMIGLEIPGIDLETKKHIRISILNSCVGMGDIDYLLTDPQLEEIVINSSAEPVRVYHKRHGWLTTNIRVNSEADIQNYSKAVARSLGKEFTIGSPMLDAHLPNGDRVNSVMHPISDKGSSVTIRMFARDPWTFTDFLANRTATSELLALFWLLVQYEMNILVSGGTGSGKTSLLNILMPFIQPNHRIVSIEDTRELQLPEFLYWCPMKTRSANQQGEGEIGMSDLLINALRMRPDRIVLGEIRKGRDAEILFEAMHTGHSVYATIHADTSTQTLRRLVNPPLNVPPVMVEAIHLNVVMYRDRMKGVRRISQVSEIIPKENIGGDVALNANTLYTWKARTDEITHLADDVRLFQEVSMHTGLTKNEIHDEIARKKTVLEWLARKNVRTLPAIGSIMRSYYLDADEVYLAVEKDAEPQSLFVEK